MSHNIIGGPFTLADGTPFPISKAVRAGDFVYLSGQLGLDEHGQLADGIEAQTECCINNIRAVLKLADLELEHVFKATVWLTDMSNFAAFNKVYGATFGAAPPVRSTVCSGLAFPAALIEIEVTAFAG